MTITPNTLSATPSSCGAGIILMRCDGPLRFFLLRGRASGIWSFPKGHPEYCDNSNLLLTAVRETYEETGLTAGTDYDFVGESQRFGKRPYWIGRVRGPAAVSRMRLSQKEHSMGGWFTINEISQLQTNVDVRAWAKKAASPNSNFVARLADAGVNLSSMPPMRSCGAEYSASAA